MSAPGRRNGSVA
jgi:uncharacterized protein (DUF1778 family)